jgi:hypothetical protein
MTIKRWSPSNEGTFEYSDGRYVLYTDILAILAERDSLLNEVAELKQELSRYREALERIHHEAINRRRNWDETFCVIEETAKQALEGGKP